AALEDETGRALAVLPENAPRHGIVRGARRRPRSRRRRSARRRRVGTTRRLRAPAGHSAPAPAAATPTAGPTAAPTGPATPTPAPTASAATATHAAPRPAQQPEWRVSGHLRRVEQLGAERLVAARHLEVHAEADVARPGLRRRLRYADQLHLGGD